MNVQATEEMCAVLHRHMGFKLASSRGYLETWQYGFIGMEATLMKRIGISSTALMLLLFGATYSFAQEKPAQHEEQGGAAHEAQPAQHEEKAPAAQHTEKAPAAQHTEKAPAAQHAEKAPPTQRTEKAPAAQSAKRSEPAKTAKPAEHAGKTEQAKPGTQRAQSATRTAPSTRTTENTRTTASTRTQQTQSAQRSQQAHNFGGHGGGHIAAARFSASFGSSHHFHMNRPTMYDGYSRFNYGGYYFGFYDTWPSDWGYSDDVYVDYIDGQYYLIDPEHPGPRLMINVVI